IASTRAPRWSHNAASDPVATDCSMRCAGNAVPTVRRSTNETSTRTPPTGAMETPHGAGHGFSAYRSSYVTILLDSTPSARLSGHRRPWGRVLPSAARIVARRERSSRLRADHELSRALGPADESRQLLPRAGEAGRPGPDRAGRPASRRGSASYSIPDHRAG